MVLNSLLTKNGEKERLRRGSIRLENAVRSATPYASVGSDDEVML